MKKLILAIILSATLIILGGCDEADRVSHNVSKEADNFNVVRRLSVTSAITNEPVFELIGTFSFAESGNRITTTVKTGPNEYKKHTVGLSEMTFWVVEDLKGADVSEYRYEVNFSPKMIAPVKFTTND